MDSEDKEVVLFPLRSHDPQVKVLRVMRVAVGRLKNERVQHIAGGPYKGIIVSKAGQEYPSTARPHVVREFLAHVQNPLDKTYIVEMRERRKVFMWFQDGVRDREAVADRFFRSLINPEHFPKDYVSFVKKVIVLTKAYEAIAKLELELSPAEEESPPISPGFTRSVTMDTFVCKNMKPQTTEQQPFEKATEVTRKIKPSPPPRTSTLSSDKRDPRPSDSTVVYTNNVSGEDRTESPVNDVTIQETYNQQTETPSSSQPADAYRPQQLFRESAEEKTWIQKSSADDTEEIDAASPDRLLKTTVITTVQTTRVTAERPPSGTHESPPPGDDTAVPAASPPPPPTQEELAARRQAILTVLEDAFPQALTAGEIARASKLSEDATADTLDTLRSKFLVQELDGRRWIRISTVRRRPKSASRLTSGLAGLRTSYDIRASTTDFQVVEQIPVLAAKEQPTVAIITLLYCEKLAVDAMMEAKTTYVKYKTEGESHVYTLGTIGEHKVVSTKLARIGSGQDAEMSAGNNVTRLLGTFSKVDHVFLVGVGGGIPCYQDDRRHVRRGDVVVSKPESAGDAVYVHVNSVESDEAGGVSFSTRVWEPKDQVLYDVIEQLAGAGDVVGDISRVMRQVTAGLTELQQDAGAGFSRPPPETDRLLKCDQDGWTEVAHPEPAWDSPRRLHSDRPVVHFGCVGSGYDSLVCMRDGEHADFRQEFALFNDVKALDSGFQAVMESVEGNRKDSFWLVRGVSDYNDGMSGDHWQHYAALGAAAVTKTILTKLPVEAS